MAIPTFDQIMKPLLVAIQNKDSIRMSEVISLMADRFQLTDEEKAERLPSDRQTYIQNRTHWAKKHLMEAGLVESTGYGLIRITDKGRQLLSSNESVFLTARDLLNYPDYQNWLKQFKIESGDVHKDGSLQNEAISEPASAFTPDELLEIGAKNLASSIKNELLEKLYSIDWFDFESLVLKVLVGMGYGGSFAEAAQTTQRTHDGGIDGIIKEDQLGLSSIYIQAKKYNIDSPISRPAVQSFVGALTGYGATKGVFITTSRFTEDAQQYANGLKALKVVLIDGHMLADFMYRLDIGVKVQRVYTIKQIDLEFFGLD